MTTKDPAWALRSQAQVSLASRDPGLVSLDLSLALIDPCPSINCIGARVKYLSTGIGVLGLVEQLGPNLVDPRATTKESSPKLIGQVLSASDFGMGTGCLGMAAGVQA